MAGARVAIARIATSTSRTHLVSSQHFSRACPPPTRRWRIPASAATLHAYYTAQLASPEYGALLEEVRVIGVYDDHDAGTNVSGRNTARARARVGGTCGSCWGAGW